MDSHRPSPMCCCERIAVMKFCKWAALADIAAHLLLSVYLTELAMAENIFVPFVISVLMLALLSALYYVGIDKDNDGLMIPMVVAKILLVLMIGLMMIFSWIAYLLSLFSLVQVESPVASLSTSDFLLLFSICLTMVFLVMLRILFLLNEGYRYVKKENDRKRMGDDFVPFVHTSMTFRPTSV
uniref:Transmembrane protein n=1 Tax=Ascaris lumbricoides TaxID=6252 RepID=A0A0M3ISI4_ASCLU